MSLTKFGQLVITNSSFIILLIKLILYWQCYKNFIVNVERIIDSYNIVLFGLARKNI